MPFSRDWTGKYGGSASIVLLPKTTEEVSKLLSYCNEQRLAVVPQGGNTGLVGGSVPKGSEIVLSLRRMNQILSFDSTYGIVKSEAGVVLETL